MDESFKLANLHFVDTDKRRETEGRETNWINRRKGGQLKGEGKADTRTAKFEEKFRRDKRAMAAEFVKKETRVFFMLRIVNTLN